MSKSKKMGDPLVSVITPAYRAEAFLEGAIRSVQSQTVSDWEMIIVDDGSPDATGPLADRLSREDPRIRVFHRERASGRPAVPRNDALALARGRYIAFLDADDLWKPEKLDVQLRHMEESAAAICFSWYERLTEDGRFLSVVRSPGNVDYRSMLRTNHIGFLTAVVDTARTGPIRFRTDLSFRMQEDYVLWLELLKKGNHATGLPMVLASYRVVTGSVSRNKWRAAEAQWRVYREVEGIGAIMSLYYWLQYIGYGLLKSLDIGAPREGN